MLDRGEPQKRFGDEALEPRVSDSHFPIKVAGLVDWPAFDAYWSPLYATTGKPSSHRLVRFEMLFLEQWYALTDLECGAQCAGRLSFRRLLGFSLADRIRRRWCW